MKIIKDKCSEYCHHIIGPVMKAEYGVAIAGCGLCQAKVPCEFEIPRRIRKESIAARPRRKSKKP